MRLLCRLGRPILLAAVIGLIGLGAREAVAGSRYHVSYLWHHDLDSVRDYRRNVGAVLGSGVARRLTIVSEGNLYGLLYMRGGGSAGAARAARVHSRLLRRAGLRGAAAMRERGWSRVTDGSLRANISAPRRHGMTPAERSRVARNLESAVARYIARMRRGGELAADERTAWSVYDLTSGEKLVTINEDTKFQAASLIKPFIAAAFFQRVEAGKFIYGAKSRRHMHRMIHWSDNRSTNWVMRQVGGPRAVQRLLRRHYGDIFQDTEIVEYIPAGGRTYRNKASPHDYSRFLYALWNGTIPGAKEIRRLMALPGADRIATGTPDIPDDIKVYNKTGSTARLCGDMGILIGEGADGRDYPYIIVGVIEKRHRARNYTAWIRTRSDIIRQVSQIVYKGIARQHGLQGVF